MMSKIKTADSVSFFVTCMADLFRPKAAQAAVRVLERHGYSVTFPAGQTCCGQFSFNAGYHREAASLARHFIEVFEPLDGPVVGISGSCVAMVHEYASLLQDEALAAGEPEHVAQKWKSRAAALAERTWEWSQWLAKLSEGEGAQANERLTAMHHMGCHMRRLLHADTEPAELLGRAGVDLVEPDDADQCCGFGGTYSMTEPAISTAIADAKLEAIQRGAQEHRAVALTGADLGCLLHLQGRLSRREESFPVLHLAEILDMAETGQLTEAALEREGRLTDGRTSSR